MTIAHSSLRLGWAKKALEKEVVNEDDYVDNIESMEQLSPITSELEKECFCYFIVS